MMDWLVDTLLATSLLMALVLLVREPVRRRFGPAVAYGLWLIPALRLLMPPLTWTVDRIAPVAGAVPLGSPRAAQSSLIPAAELGLIQQFGGWETLAVAAWLTGAGAMLLCGFLIYRRQRRGVLRDSGQVARLGNIRIVRSTAVRGPMAFGIFDRVIALPIDFDERYDPRERRLALDHELAHHRSGDLIINYFAFALLCLQWFNPLAWLSHSAFRFDQEAACDARVVEKASSEDRAAYAKAIAKAASGRVLLFAGVLDRPGTLRRRLRSMLTITSTSHRLAGKAMIALTASAALPLTASWATEFVDIPAPHIAASRIAATGEATSASARTSSVLISAAAATAPMTRGGDALSPPDLGGVTLGRNDIAFMADDTILINGARKRLDQLDASERARLRTAILRSQRDLARDRANLPRELAAAQRDADRARSGELRRERTRDIEDMRRDLAELDSRAGELRSNGEDPATRRAEILRDLREAETTDIAAEEREAIEEADPNRRLAELRAEEEQMARLLTRLRQLAGR
jgi:bla regulator protein blaR1